MFCLIFICAYQRITLIEGKMKFVPELHYTEIVTKIYDTSKYILISTWIKRLTYGLNNSTN
jgi:hypothetical protein